MYYHHYHHHHLEARRAIAWSRALQAKRDLLILRRPFTDRTASDRNVRAYVRDVICSDHRLIAQWSCSEGGPRRALSKCRTTDARWCRWWRNIFPSWERILLPFVCAVCSRGHHHDHASTINCCCCRCSDFYCLSLRWPLRDDNISAVTDDAGDSLQLHILSLI